MNVKEEFFRLKDRWIHFKGEEQKKADAEMQAFFDSLNSEDSALLEEAVNEDFARIRKDVACTYQLAEQISIRKQLESVLQFQQQYTHNNGTPNEEFIIKYKMRDILFAISWREISKTYFGKSSTWIYEKLDGRDGNGKPTSFTPEETMQLKGALCDLAERIRRCADSI